MFDTIGVDPDEEAGRRRSVSALVTLMLAAGVAGAVLGAGLVWTHPRTATPDPVPMPPMVDLTDPGPDEPPPALPAAPAARGGRADPETPPDVPQPLTSPPPQPIADHAADHGTGDDPGVGPGHGPPDAPPCVGGRCGPGGTGIGDGGGGVRVFHHSELEVRRRVDPRYPAAAQALGLGEQRCVARVSIDEDGVPTEVEVDDCPAVFHAATREALLAWRWYPPRDGKRRVKALTSIAVVYRVP